MGQFLPILYGLCFFSPVAACICAGFFYAHHCTKNRPDKRVSGIAYVLALLVCAVVGYFIGLQSGIAWACSSPSSGNLCGLAGVFVAGPLAAALAIFLVSGSLVFLRGRSP